MTQQGYYAAQAFYKGFSGGKAAGQLKVSATDIVFSHPDQQVTIPRQGAVIKLGGASDRLVFISHPHFPEWTLYTSDRSILRDPALAADPVINTQLSKARRKRTVNHSVLWGVVALVFLVPVLLITRMDLLTGLAVTQVPVEWEMSLGESVFAQYQLNEPMLDDEAATQQLTALAKPLLDELADSPFEFQLHIAESSELNAFALPGGIMVINSGLILAADSAEEVLGVVAHELAHVTQRHGIRNIMGTAGIYLIVQTVLGDVSGLLAVLVDAAPLLINQSYSRGFETEADEHAVALLQRARIDPAGLVDFFDTMLTQEAERMENIDSENTRRTLEQVNRFLSTHPATQDRIEHLQQRIDPLSGPYRDLSPEFSELQQLLRQLQTEPTEEAL